jgi:hypothetical protein
MCSPAKDAASDTLVSIPAELLQALREGVYAELRDAAEGVVQLTQKPGECEQAERYVSDRTRMAEAFALLEAVGWQSTHDDDAGEQRDVQLALLEHATVLIAALTGAREDAADALQDVAAGRQTDPARCEAIRRRAAGLSGLTAALQARVDGYRTG